jgi:hypothetical protein
VTSNPAPTDRRTIPARRNAKNVRVNVGPVFFSRGGARAGGGDGLRGGGLAAAGAAGFFATGAAGGGARVAPGGEEAGAAGRGALGVVGVFEGGTPPDGAGAEGAAGDIAPGAAADAGSGCGVVGIAPGAFGESVVHVVCFGGTFGLFALMVPRSRLVGRRWGRS